LVDLFGLGAHELLFADWPLAKADLLSQLVERHRALWTAPEAQDRPQYSPPQLLVPLASLPQDLDRLLRVGGDQPQECQRETGWASLAGLPGLDHMKVDPKELCELLSVKARGLPSSLRERSTTH
jgi:hypothetical protein